MNDKEEFLQAAEKADVTTDDFRQKAYENMLQMNEHLEHVNRLAKIIMETPSVDQLTPEAWRDMNDLLPSLIVMNQFLQDTLKASATFISDGQAMEMIKGKMIKDLRERRDDHPL